MGQLEDILCNVSPNTDKSSHMSYFRKQLPKLGGIFKCAGISGSMEAFFLINVLMLIRRCVRDCFCQAWRQRALSWPSQVARQWLNDRDKLQLSSSKEMSVPSMPDA